MVKDGKICISEIFESIDGEGYNAGYPTVFFRTVGCNLRCNFCFAADKSGRFPYVTMDDFTKKPLNEVRVGDWIYTLDENSKLTLTQVKSVNTHESTEYDLICFNQTSFVVTPEHPFWVDGKWKNAGDLQVGDLCRRVAPSEYALAKIVSPESLKILQEQSNYLINHYYDYVGHNAGERNGNYRDDFSQHNYNRLKTLIQKNVVTIDILTGEKGHLVVHHLDENPENDSPNNLVIITTSLHNQVHTRGYNFGLAKREFRFNSPVLSHSRSYGEDFCHQLGHKPKLFYNLSCTPYNTFLVDDFYVHNCDSVYTFKEDNTCRWLNVKEALEEIRKYKINHITITGGEPLLEENKEWMTEFITELVIQGYLVDIETNGAIDYSYWREKFNPNNVVLITDWKAPSSKMNKFMIESNLRILTDTDIVKIVVRDEDFNEVEKVLKSGTRAQVYISPVFGEVTMNKIPEFILTHKEYSNLRAQIQLHKVFWDPNKRGV